MPKHSKGKMRTAIMFFLLASPVFAQSAVTTAAPAACGPASNGIQELSPEFEREPLLLVLDFQLNVENSPEAF
jgi:hypothetical protein